MIRERLFVLCAAAAFSLLPACGGDPTEAPSVLKVGASLETELALPLLLVFFVQFVTVRGRGDFRIAALGLVLLIFTNVASHPRELLQFVVYATCFVGAALLWPSGWRELTGGLSALAWAMVVLAGY